MKLFNQYSKVAIYVAGIALLTACGGADEEQDSSNVPVNNQVTLTGLAMNGYLANALVWVDVRGNNTLDGFEPFAYTDNQGFFSYNPNSGTNYCASTEASLQRFCLQVPSGSGDLVLKAAKGIELLSGEAFRSVLTANVSVSQAQQNFTALQTLGARPLGNTGAWQSELDAVQTKLSPLSSVAHYLPADTSLATVLVALGYDIPVDMSNTDILAKEYIAALEHDDPLADDLFAAAITLSRLVDTLAANLDEATSDANFGEDGLPISTADSIYEGLAQSLTLRLNSSSSLTRSASSVAINKGSQDQSTQMLVNDVFPASDLLAASINNLISVLNTNNVNNSNLQNLLNSIGQNTQLNALLTTIGNIGVEHFSNIDQDADILAQMLTLNQSVTLPTLTAPIAFANAQDALAINVLATFMQNPSNRISELLSTATEQFVSQRGEETALTLSVDLNTLTQSLVGIAKQNNGASDLASNDVPVSLTELAQVNTPDDSSFWANQGLSLSGLQDGNEQGQVLMFFSGESTAQAGELVMCVAYRNDTDPSENISSQRFVGTWSVIGGNSQNRLSLVAEGFNIQMKVLGESLGADIPSEQQIPSIARMSNETYGRYGFTLNEDTATWHSDDASVNQSFGLTMTTNIPATDSECAQGLSLQVN